MKFEFDKIKSMSRRDRIIALAVCSVIFITVLIIALVTASSSSEPAPQEEQPQPQSTAEVTARDTAAPAVAPTAVAAPAPQYIYKRNDAPASYSEFDFSSARQLPRILDKQKFTAGILIDLDSRKVLWERNSTTAVPIASMSKLMTVYTAFEEMEKRNITLNCKVTASESCSKVDNVRINLKPGEKYTLHELFICSLLPSANDASFLIAEYFGYGDTRKFIELMNQKALQIGMTSSNFVNANGLTIYNKDRSLPSRMNMASCLDMVKLIERIYEYPVILRYTKAPTAQTSQFGKVKNSNRLLTRVPGMEGMKTGYTIAAGNCLAFSCNYQNRRLVGVVTGFDDRQQCFTFAQRLLEWGYKN